MELLPAHIFPTEIKRFDELTSAPFSRVEINRGLHRIPAVAGEESRRVEDIRGPEIVFKIEALVVSEVVGLGRAHVGRQGPFRPHDEVNAVTRGTGGVL